MKKVIIVLVVLSIMALWYTYNPPKSALEDMAMSAGW